MGLLGLFKKKNSAPPKDFQAVSIKEIVRLTPKSVKVVLNATPSNLAFQAGQYLDFWLEIDGEEERRSYSICSGPQENIAVAVKEVEGGCVSKYFNREAKAEDVVYVHGPSGQFTLQPEMKNIVAFAAGSGITPILAIAKNLDENSHMKLFYANQSIEETLFFKEIQELQRVETQFFFTRKAENGHAKGRFTGEVLSSIIKENLSLLKADAYFICGPFEMTESVIEKLRLFGVAETKIKRELFTPPVEEVKKPEPKEGCDAKVTVILDGESIKLDYKKDGIGVLEILNREGYDPPYSCRGGVCSTCKARIKQGSATMKLNYVLTEEEIAAGEILTCQMIPTSPEVTVSYDE